MKIVERFREYVAARQLARELREIRREKANIPLDQVKNIGVLYSIDNEETYNRILNFIKSIKTDQRSIIGMGLLNEKTVPTYINQTVYNSIINIKDLNWYLKPVNQYVNNFYNENFDLCINLSLEEHYPLHYIMAHCNARFKAGKYSERYKDCYDLLIKADDSMNQQDFISNMMHYLEMINKSST